MLDFASNVNINFTMIIMVARPPGYSESEMPLCSMNVSLFIFHDKFSDVIQAEFRGPLPSLERVILVLVRAP